MEVQDMHDPRPISNDLTPTGDEFRKAYFGYYAYWRTYNINEVESAVEHKIQSSERPWEVGLTPKRTVRFAGTKLVLSTLAYKVGAFAQVQDDEMLVNRLTWVRLEGVQ
jgi:hypothetical protein